MFLLSVFSILIKGIIFNCSIYYYQAKYIYLYIREIIIDLYNLYVINFIYYLILFSDIQLIREIFMVFSKYFIHIFFVFLII
uniref:Uncharacterized protein n=1 Tax=Cliftonaea pectinata TaxID=2007206 RepID=A0A1Z1MQV5_9FLOR|nr:hypothetical protein [Cliftonaea pectinata]ARW68141.1 hypothetical protein [Cliftonaea pectinata]